MEPTTERGSVASGLLHSLLAWAAEIQWSLVSLVAVVFYGVLRFSYSLFYSRFGVTPEEAGISYSQLLSQSVIAVCILMAIYFMFSLYFFYSVKYLAQETQNTAERLEGYWSRFLRELHSARQRSKTLSVWFLLYRPAFIASLVLLIAGQKRMAYVLLGLSVYGFLLIQDRLRPLAQPEGHGKAGLPSPEPKAHARTREFLKKFLIKKRTVVFLGLVSVIAVVLGILPFWASRDAISVKRGEAVNLDWPISLWRADSAVVFWLGDAPSRPPALTPRRKFMYLGQANGVAVLYDVEDRQTLRVPSGRIAIQTMR